ncbi:unnamed protein product [Cunninghamella echinulata]
MSLIVNNFHQLVQNIEWLNTNYLLEWYEQHIGNIVSNPNNKGKRITIGIAVGLAVLYSYVDHVSRPPKHLRHLPYINKFTSIRRFIFDKWPTYKISKELVAPILKNPDNTMYLRNDKFGWVLHVVGSNAVKQVFMKSDVFPKLDQSAINTTIIYKLLGVSNILFSDGQEWKKHRKIVNPAFHKSLPVKLFGEKSREWIAMLDETQPDTFTLDFNNEMERFTLDIIGEAGFGFKFNSVKNKNSPWRTVYDSIIQGHREPLHHMFPSIEKYFLWMLPRRKRIHDQTLEFLDMLQTVIDNKRQVLKNKNIDDIEENEKDLLTLMLEGELRGEGVLTDREILNDLGVFFIAGHDTTSFSLVNICYFLAKNPDIQEKARQEIIRVLCPNGEEPMEEIIPTIDQTKEFVYLNQIIKEGLRINGTVNFLPTPRITSRDIELDGKYVPKGTMVNVNIYDLHHNKNIWQDPDTFNPDRFAEGGEADQLAGRGLSWVPFANGSRMCIGMNFSLVEQKIFLACLLRKYHWSLPEDSVHRHQLETSNATLMMVKSLEIRFDKKRY